MPEEQQPAATAQPQTPPTPDGSTGDPPALPELDRATLLALLDKHSDDPEFRKELSGRRVIGGIAGELSRQQREQEKIDAAREAVEKEKVRIKGLYESDRVAFADEIMTKLDLEEERREKAGLRDLTRREFAGKVGDALRDLPEFSELTAADVQALEASLRGVPDDDVIVVFTKKATDLVADKRAAKRTEATINDRLAEERKVWEREQAEKRVKTRQAPNVRQPSAGNASDDAEPANFLSPEWAAWDRNQRKAGRGIYAGAR